MSYTKYSQARDLINLLDDLGDNNILPKLKKFLKSNKLEDLNLNPQDFSPLNEREDLDEYGGIHELQDGIFFELADILNEKGHKGTSHINKLIGMMHLMKNPEYGQGAIDAFGEDNINEYYGGLEDLLHSEIEDYDTYHEYRDLPSDWETIARLHGGSFRSAMTGLRNYIGQMNEYDGPDPLPEFNQSSDLTDYSFRGTDPSRSRRNFDPKHGALLALQNRSIDMPQSFREAGITHDDVRSGIHEIEWDTKPEAPASDKRKALDALATWRKQIAPNIPKGTALESLPASPKLNTIYKRMGFTSGNQGIPGHAIMGDDNKLIPFDTPDNYKYNWY